MNFTDENLTIAIGKTRPNSMVDQIANKQLKFFKTLFKNVELAEKPCEQNRNIIHKYGVMPCDSNKDLFILHFDPYDARHNIDPDDLEIYLKKFKTVICINTKQLYFCNKRNINATVIYHGSDINPNSKHEKINASTTIAMVCDYYAGNVKGENYFLEIAKSLSDVATFQIIGKNWPEHYASDHVEVVNTKSYNQLLKHFRHVSALFIGSRYEAGPASYPDAVNSSKYVISTPVGMVLENLNVARSGFFLTFNKEEDIKNIKHIISDVKADIKPIFKFNYESWEQQFLKILESF